MAALGHGDPAIVVLGATGGIGAALCRRMAQRARIVLAPGLVETPLTARLTSSEAVARASRAMHALGRLGRPDDVASIIAWLIEPENSWVTGQIFGVDGGLAAVRAQ